MGIIDDIRQMQQQGYNEDEITQKLMEAGYSPKDINYSISQSKIKSAIVDNVQNSMINQEMQPSMMNQEQSQPMPQAQQAYQEYYQPQQQEYYPQQSGVSTETITEISEQIITEKLTEVRKVINAMLEFKSITDARVAGIDERLKRIESIISNLQTSIIGKIGSFGQGIEDIKEEMSMMQSSFSKMISPKKRQDQNTDSAESEEQPTDKENRAKKQKPGFEDFLRGQ